MAIIDEFWTDLDDTLKIDMLDLSMLRVTMFNTRDSSKFDTSYLCKSDVVYLINYLNKVVDKMCHMPEEICNGKYCKKT